MRSVFVRSVFYSLISALVVQNAVGLPHFPATKTTDEAPLQRSTFSAMTACGQDALCMGDALKKHTRFVGDTDEILAELLRLASGQVPFAKPLDCRATNCSDPAQYFEKLAVHGNQVPLLAVVDSSSPPPVRNGNAPWPEFLGSASSFLPPQLQRILVQVISEFEIQHGPIRTALKIGLDARYFQHGYASAQVLAIHFVAEGLLIVNPAIAQDILRWSSGGGSESVVEMFSELRTIIANLAQSSAQASQNSPTETNAASFANANVALVDVTIALAAAHGIHKPATTSLDPTRAASSGTLDSTNMESTTLAHVPWKCFWCIVALCYLLPVVSNLAAQELGTVYCSLQHLKPEECVEIRYAIIAIMVLVTPLEVFPIVKACHVQEKCHSDSEQRAAVPRPA